ncbi:MAG: hypothetical protein NUV84_00925 [Candidatus Uhrbacteria bacterium]|nr:hypothetical protein [Candidatus Uhrbacteria bacterium]
MNRQTILAALLVCASLAPWSAQAYHDDGGDSFLNREYVGSGQLIVCDALPNVYYIGQDGKRYVFPNEQTFKTWYWDFSFVAEVACEDLSVFPLAGVMTYQPGTRYLKQVYEPTVYAVEPGGILRAIPDEHWMETFVGDEWEHMIDDIPEALWTSYTVGEPLELMEIPDGMTGQDPESGTFYYFVDSDPYSLDGISYGYLHNDRFKDFTRTQDIAANFYVRALPAMREAGRIQTKDELYLGIPKLFAFSEEAYLDADAEVFTSVEILSLREP